LENPVNIFLECGIRNADLGKKKKPRSSGTEQGLKNSRSLIKLVQQNIPYLIPFLKYKILDWVSAFALLCFSKLIIDPDGNNLVRRWTLFLQKSATTSRTGGMEEGPSKGPGPRPADGR